jgi:glucokinase
LLGLQLGEGVPAPAEFPQPGSLESLAAGGVLDRLAAQTAAEHPGSRLGRLAEAERAVDGHDAVAAAKAGDPDAIACLRVLGERLGIGIANAINTFDPDIVAVGGGVSSAGELLVGPAREVALGYVLPGVGERTEIRVSRYGVQAGVRGAALLAGLELTKAEEAFLEPRREAERA